MGVAFPGMSVFRLVKTCIKVRSRKVGNRIRGINVGRTVVGVQPRVHVLEFSLERKCGVYEAYNYER